MSGYWIISYVGLWIVVIILCFLLVGLVQQLGFIRRHLAEGVGAASQVEEDQGKPGVLPELSEDGPDLGSSIPELTLETFNNDKVPLTPASWHHQHGTLVIFLSAVCESCQHIVSLINQLVDNRIFTGRVIVVLRADQTLGQGFINVFPLHVPVVRDQTNKIAMGFDVHRMPFSLFYDTQGKLIRKGNVTTYEGLLLLIGDPTISPAAFPEELVNIYPSLKVEHNLVDEDILAPPTHNKR